jgi:uncharacterized sulfatase
MTRREWIAALFSSLQTNITRPPNVVLIIADDHGWSDYGFMGHPVVQTPNLDKLAARSVAYTRGYVPASLCRPSLASIMTGLYPHQHGITGNDPPGNPKSAKNRASMVRIFERSKTIAGLLGDKGYVSHQSGKWWEGECKCCGFTACMTHGDVTRGGRHGDEGLKIGRETMQPVYNFIDGAGKSPFFIWYAPFLPHTPHNPPERLLSKYQKAGRPLEVARYYAMVDWLDETVGGLLGHLENKGLTNDTVIVYLADNGWVQLEGKRELYETRAKMSPFDAGLRTPLLLSWPGRIAPKKEDKLLASSVDIAPTVLTAAGLKPPEEMPGLDLANRVAVANRNSVFGSIFTHTAVDVNNPVKNLKYRWMVRDFWKLIDPYQPNADLPLWEGRPGTGWLKEVALFDLTADPREQNNVAAQNPEVVRSLKAALDVWWNVSE